MSSFDRTDYRSQRGSRNRAQKLCLGKRINRRSRLGSFPNANVHEHGLLMRGRSLGIISAMSMAQFPPKPSPRRTPMIARDIWFVTRFQTVGLRTVWRRNLHRISRLRVCFPKNASGRAQCLFSLFTVSGCDIKIS